MNSHVKAMQLWVTVFPHC